MPALLNRRSTRPNRSITWANRASTSSGLPTSACTAKALDVGSPDSSTTDCSNSSRRPHTATENPSRHSAKAVSLPIPVPPPVTTATLASLFISPFYSHQNIHNPNSAANLSKTSLQRLPLRVPAEAGTHSTIPSTCNSEHQRIISPLPTPSVFPRMRESIPLSRRGVPCGRPPPSHPLH